MPQGDPVEQPTATRQGDQVTASSAVSSFLHYSSYHGGTGADVTKAVATDSAGNAYVLGDTASADYPATTGAYDETLNGSNDCFIAKFDGSTGALVWATYLGGTGTETGRSITVDASGDILVTGQTSSSDFPTTPGANDTVLGGSWDAFVTKLAANGSVLLWSTYLGGTGDEMGSEVRVTSDGHAAVAGYTNSLDFPTTKNAHKTAQSGNWDAFVTTISPADGAMLNYSTLYGDNSSDQYALGLAVDSQDHVLAVGYTDGTTTTTGGAYDTSFGGGTEDGFLARLSTHATGASDLIYGTYLGSSSADRSLAVDADASDHAVVAGQSLSPTFPASASAYDTSHNGGWDMTLTVIDPAGGGASDLSYSTFVGTNDNEYLQDVAVATDGTIVGSGYTGSDGFPTVVGSYDELGAQTGPYEYDAVLLRLVPLSEGARDLLYCTMLGGSGDESQTGLGLAASGETWFSTSTTSTDYPTTAAAEDTDLNSTDAAVSRLNVSEMLAPNVGVVSAPATADKGEQFTLSVNVTDLRPQDRPVSRAWVALQGGEGSLALSNATSGTRWNWTWTGGIETSGAQSHVIHAQCSDGASNSTTWGITIGYEPNVRVAEQSDAVVLEGTVWTVRAYATDGRPGDAGLKNVTLELGSGRHAMEANGTDHWIATVLLRDSGVYSWRVTAHDLAGNSNSTAEQTLRILSFEATEAGEAEEEEEEAGTSIVRTSMLTLLGRVSTGGWYIYMMVATAVMLLVATNPRGDPRRPRTLIPGTSWPVWYLLVATTAGGSAVGMTLSGAFAGQVLATTVPWAAAAGWAVLAGYQPMEPGPDKHDLRRGLIGLALGAAAVFGVLTLYVAAAAVGSWWLPTSFGLAAGAGAAWLLAGAYVGESPQGRTAQRATSGALIAASVVLLVLYFVIGGGVWS